MPKLDFKIDYKCKLCDEVFKSQNGFSLHLAHTHTITAQSYYDKYIKQPDEGICLYCKKPTNFTGKLSLGYHKYCSNSCKLLAGVNKPPIDLECKICGLQIKGHYYKDQMRHLNKHLKTTHNINDIKDYYDRFYKKPGEGECIYCGKPTNFRNFKDGYLKSCSVTCGLTHKNVINRKLDKENKQEKEQRQITQEELLKELKERVQKYEWTGDRNSILFNEVDFTKTDYYQPEQEDSLKNNEFENYDDFVSELSWL